MPVFPRSAASRCAVAVLAQRRWAVLLLATLLVFVHFQPVAQARAGRYRLALSSTSRRVARPRGLPVRGRVRITSRFGWRIDPFTHRRAFHNGIDFAGRRGTPIFATAPGIVGLAGWSRGGYGKRILIRHGRGWSTLYGHLSRIKVRPGMRVRRRQLIGRMGSTGRSTAPHLHYTIFRRGRAINPRPFLRRR
ncbi:M23 family metallopeptidase [Gloeobacter kilaueensis]|uniref:Peptidase M23 n=1 Tax=Gloeobacter kilaueensis (strain ATCC BAA-2537 / CCAP 1431/1 / ULC 316 / JS1) TaxID=1183438 RepID=U5QL96_GLOK1|nr:M23 family metallopeptidase [Gloeobacter kilaueensis]AGY58435.1 peptidase M23 [Gloeobacter kilaueensis JS1]